MKLTRKHLIIYIIVLILLFIGGFSVGKALKNNEQKTNTNIVENDISNDDTKTSNEETINETIIKDRFEGLELTTEDIGIPVLYYHSVVDESEIAEKNEVVISAQQLRAELQLVKDLGYTPLTISEVNDYLNNNKAIPKNSILITFDDGYMDNYVHAFPILQELDMKATIFVISSGIDGGYYLSSDQIKEMSDYGIDIESHTVNHVHLNSLSYEEQLKELTDSKAKIESITNKPVLSIAYPFGDYDENSEKAAIAAGYSLAFTTNLGLANKTDNRVSLDRIYVSSDYSLDLFKDRLINTSK